MEIVTHWPPNIEKISAVFPIGPNTIFTYGDCIYNPYGLDLPEHVIRHEQAHAAQQSRCISPDAWWHLHLNDQVFRLEQEIEAYRAQWQFIKTEVKDRNKRHMILLHLAGELSGPTYGHIITRCGAYNQISKL